MKYDSDKGRLSKMLKGIMIKPIKRFPDERGFFAELMRNDWVDLFGEDQVVQANLSSTYPGVIRAWHRHLRGQNDYFLVLDGAVKICVYDEKTQELDEIVSSSLEFQALKVPGHFWHGFKNIGIKPATLLYFTTRLYDHKNPDEDRMPWNDQSVIPKSISGKKDDPRVGKPWDWEQLPYK
jgi:dTDP-4-dehydrorhamnose 3,5-epimerase